jgi:hypothetical protein
MVDRDWAAVFSDTFASPVSAVDARVWGEVFGDDYPADLGTYSFITKTEPVGRPPQIQDHRPLLERAGFRVLAYDETDAWRERQTRIDELLLQSVDELAREADADPVEVRNELEEMHATLDCIIGRVFVVALRAT